MKNIEKLRESVKNKILEHADDSGYVRLDEILPALAAGFALRAGAGALGRMAMRAGGSFLARRAAARAAARTAGGAAGGAARGGAKGFGLGTVANALSGALGSGTQTNPEPEKYGGGSASVGTSGGPAERQNPTFRPQTYSPGSYLPSRLQGR